MSRKLTEFDRSMSAVAFAEAGEFETARKMTSAKGSPQKSYSTNKKKKPVPQMVFFGIISLTAYLLLFKYQDWVTNTFTMGGWYAAYPIITAFLFSFIHGAFASNLLSVMGLEAKK